MFSDLVAPCSPGSSLPNAENATEFASLPSQKAARPRRGKLLDVCAERFPEHDRKVISSLIIQGKVVLLFDEPGCTFVKL